MSFALGLVGCGGMGRRHLRGMERLARVGKLSFELAAVCDVLPESAQQAADMAQSLFGQTPVPYHDLETMLRNTRLDGLIITTTPEMHIPVGEMALDAGVHLMVEKPITLTIAEGVRLVGAARAANKRLAVAENYRRDPMNRLAKTLIDQGAIGKPYLAVQSSSSAGEMVIITPWRHLKNRGGIVVDMGVHYTDILEYLLGPLRRVFALNQTIDVQRRDANGALHRADAEDLSVGVAQFANGALAHWLLNMAGRGENQFSRLVHGMEGSLTIPMDRTGQPLRLHRREAGQDRLLSDADLLALVPDYHLDPVTAALFGSDRPTQYALEWATIDANLLAIEQADFVASVIEDRAPEVDGEQGLRSLALVFAMLEAGMLGRMVDVDEILSGRLQGYEQSIGAAV
jgi:predicted dehydrogenase